MNKIIFLTNYKNIIPQRKSEIEGLKLNIISEVLIENGYDVEIISIQTFIVNLTKNQNIKDVFFCYASSQYPIYKNFIQDILVQIRLREGILVPELRHFIAHENKNFQELEKFRLGIKSPYGIPIGTYEEGVEVLEKVSYPQVIKKSIGFRSRNVKLARNKKEGKRILHSILDDNFKFDMDSLYYLYRRIKSRKHYPIKFGKAIIQEYIADLNYDWKILVLGSICVGGKRFVRKNDFRASGTNHYSLEEDPPKEVLDFALECKEKLNCPNISLDISEQSGDVQLLEYQAVHFSLLTWESVYYFELLNGNWIKKNINKDLEFHIGNGIAEHINKFSREKV